MFIVHLCIKLIEHYKCTCGLLNDKTYPILQQTIKLNTPRWLLMAVVILTPVAEYWGPQPNTH